MPRGFPARLSHPTCCSCIPDTACVGQASLTCVRSLACMSSLACRGRWLCMLPVRVLLLIVRPQTPSAAASPPDVDQLVAPAPAAWISDAFAPHAQHLPVQCHLWHCQLNAAIYGGYLQPPAAAAEMQWQDAVWYPWGLLCSAAVSEYAKQQQCSQGNKLRQRHARNHVLLLCCMCDCDEAVAKLSFILE
jgi:hypothetical protein